MSNFSDYVFRQFDLRTSINTIGLPGSLLIKVDNSSLRNYVPLAQGTVGQILTSNGEDNVPLWRDNLPFEINLLEADTIVATDLVPFYDKSESATKKTTFAVFETALNHDNLIAGTIASHDTSATGAELTALTDNSIANTLHRHSELVASDGSPDPALGIDADGNIITKLTLKNSGNDTAPLGEELVDNGEFTSDLTDWTFNGVDWVWNAGKAEHVDDNVSTFVQGISVVNGEIYQVEFITSNRSVGAVTLTFGAMVGSYAITRNTTYYYSFKAIATGSKNLTFTPTINWDGRLDNVTVKQITGTSDAVLLLEDSNGDNSIEARTVLDNTFIGLDAGQYSTTGTGNTGIGHQANYSNTIGLGNTGIGHQANYSNTTGTGNTGLGYRANYSNVIGAFNTAFGNYANHDNTTGTGNTGIGNSALQKNTSNNNTGIGFASFYSNTTGNNNTGIGLYTFYSNITGAGNTGIGNSAAFEVTDGDNNTVIGYNTGRGITTGDYNTIIGANVTGLAADLQSHIIIADGAGNQRIIVNGAGNTVFSGGISSGTLTITASADDTDVSGINTLFVNTTAGAIVLGGLKNGVDGQVLHIVYINNFVNTLTIEHVEGINQDFYNHTGADEVVDGGGMTYVCNGTNWYDASHAKHI